MTPSSSSSSQHVRVAVHVRPLLPGETGDLDSVSIEGGKRVLFGAGAAAGGSNSTTTTTTNEQQQQHRSAVAFDLAAGLSAGGVDPALLYETCVSPLVEGLFEGFNASVLAYGPTGSGKTFTMGTDFSGSGNSGGGFSGCGGGNESSSNNGGGGGASSSSSAAAMMPGGGIVPRVVQDLFSRVERVLQQGKGGGGRSEAGEEGGSSSFFDVVEACSVRVGFVEVYAEEVRDLLSPSSSGPLPPLSSGSPAESSAAAAAPFFSSSSAAAAAPTITLRDSEGSGSRNGSGNGSPLSSSGATEVEVSTAEELGALLSLAGRRRATGATAVNAASSRSHAIVTLTVEQRGRRRRRRTTTASDAAAAAATAGPETTTGTTVSAKMCLVDLAGSERQKRTLATGARLKEATAINRGLLALGNVIGALAAQSKAAAAAAAGAATTTTTTTTTAAGASNPSLQQQQQQIQQHRHIPYRDSKLTRLLADALGGASRTLLVACVSRADADADEAAATLRYAARARAIVNVPRANISASSYSGCSCVNGSLCAANAAELESLRMELVGARGRIAALERELLESRGRERAAVVAAAPPPPPPSDSQLSSVRPCSEAAARYAAEAAAARARAAALRAAAAAEGGGREGKEGAGATGAAAAAAAAAAAETTTIAAAAARIMSPASRPPLPPPAPAPGPLAAGALRAGVERKQGAAETAATTTKPPPPPPPPSSSLARRVALSSVDGNSPERKQAPQSSSRWW